MAWSALCSQSHSLSIVVLTFIFSFRLRVFMCQTILSEAAVCTGCPEVGYICLNKLFDVTDSFIWHLAISYTSKNFRWPDTRLLELLFLITLRCDEVDNMLGFCLINR